MTLHQRDPLEDPRWTELVERSPFSSVFHSTPWLRALRDTYGFTPVVFTDAAPGEPLRNALLFCRVDSWLTGRRLVSVPFSDHCEPLVDNPDTLTSMLESLRVNVAPKERYIELRPLRMPVGAQFGTSETFWFHNIDLRPSLDEIFGRFHKNHVQRNIRKAERSGLVYEVGRSEQLLTTFYELHLGTRRKHGAPPQPFKWFQHLASSFGDLLNVHVASFAGRPAAALLMIRHGSSLVYKYGASDAALNRHGGTVLLFWKAIQAAKELGLEGLDLGRSDVDQEGLVAFKDHLGGVREALHYYRYPAPADAQSGGTLALARKAFALVPTPIQDAVGRGLFKHFG